MGISPKKVTSFYTLIGWEIIFMLPLERPYVLLHCHKGTEGEEDFRCEMFLSDIEFLPSQVIQVLQIKK